MSRNSGAAVDEGRDPYGLPGRGNADEVWRRLNDVPCPDCGSTSKALTVERDKASIVCGPLAPCRDDD